MLRKMMSIPVGKWFGHTQHECNNQKRPLARRVGASGLRDGDAE